MGPNTLGRPGHFGSLASRFRDIGDAKHLRELYLQKDPEAVIKLFESRASLHSYPSAVAEYVKALVKKSSKGGVLGTSSAPVHMVNVKEGNFKDQLWRTLRALGLAFVIISGVGALIEDNAIGKVYMKKYDRLRNVILSLVKWRELMRRKLSCKKLFTIFVIQSCNSFPYSAKLLFSIPFRMLLKREDMECYSRAATGGTLLKLPYTTIFEYLQNEE
ncbi:hypothetical protein ACS0TY_003938 [Phlomoides rotata]